MSAPPRKSLHVLVVDDSAVVREVLSAIVGAQPGMSVASAADPLIAQQKIRQARPDVIVLDLEMPRMDGLTFLRQQMADDPIPVVVCSGLAGPGTEAAIQALQAGAVEVVTKPRLGVRGFLTESAQQLLEALQAAAGARLRPLRPVAAWQPVPGVAPRALRETTDKVLALGASTGGTEALRAVLGAMPPDCPGIVVVQHMPEVFTAAFARGLDRTCSIEVREAADGDRVLAGRALIAPGNRHLQLARTGAHYLVRVVDGPPVSRHRPSVDVLFHSVARAAGPNAVGVLMTGMGDDGAEGLLAMRRAGAPTLAQDEASCVVFGMPREAIRRGAVEAVVPLDQIAAAMLARAHVR